MGSIREDLEHEIKAWDRYAETMSRLQGKTACCETCWLRYAEIRTAKNHYSRDFHHYKPLPPPPKWI